jgi:hypothetical protein
MPQLTDADTISCSSSGYRINIINAYLFDSGSISQQSNCTLKPEQFGLLKHITDQLQNYCALASNCSISKSFLINSMADSQVIRCLTASIFYNCVAPSINNHRLKVSGVIPLEQNQNFEIFGANRI